MLLIRETFINADEGYVFGESEPYEAWTDEPGRLFRTMQREYGRCVSSIYIDPPEGGPPIRCGWVFQGKQRYEDTNEPYTREVWVHLYDQYEQRVVTDATPHVLGRGV